jgi:molybdate transport system substrate-binding protein
MKITPLSVWALGAIMAAVVAFTTGTAHAEQITVIAGGGFVEPLKALTPAFEARTGHKITARFGTAPQLVTMSAKPFDVIISPEGVFGVDASRGRFASGTPPAVAKVDIGIAVLKDAARPDIRTTAAFKQALLGARGVSSLPASATGAKLEKIYQKLGIADAMKTKLRAQTTVPGITEAVAKGDAELAIFTLNVLATDARLDVVGPIPDEVQDAVVYFGSTSTATRVPEAAQALLNFLKSPQGAAIIKSKGMTPG